MNSSVYVFGRLAKGYTQYPNDYTERIFQKFQAEAIGKSQIIVHRDNNLMYYGYIRKLDVSHQYIGFCVLLNGVMFSRIGDLFHVFEEAVSELVSKEEILEFDDKGNIESRIEYLCDKSQEVERITSFIRNGFSGLEDIACKLPLVDYGISKNESISFSIADDDEKIIDAIGKYGYTCIFKEADCEPISLLNSISVIKRLRDEKIELLDKYNKLKDNYNTLKKAKKQYRNVVFLCLIIFCCGIGSFFLYSELDDTKNDLYDLMHSLEQKTMDISELEDQNSELEGQNDTLQASITYVRSEIGKIGQELSEYKNYCKEYLPIIITNVEVANKGDDFVETDFGNDIYSKNTMYLCPRITYKGIVTSRTITLNVKLYNSAGKLSKGSSSPSDCSYSKRINIYSGDGNTCEVGEWGNLKKGVWSRGKYRYEFWYNGICLKTKTFRIY